MSTVSIPLSRARLCQDCQCVSEMRGEPSCTVCGSQSWMPLSTWLDRKNEVREVMHDWESILPSVETIRALLHAANSESEGQVSVSDRSVE